jgi:hypothetical protein
VSEGGPAPRVVLPMCLPSSKDDFPRPQFQRGLQRVQDGGLWSLLGPLCLYPVAFLSLLGWLPRCRRSPCVLESIVFLRLDLAPGSFAVAV